MTTTVTVRTSGAFQAAVRRNDEPPVRVEPDTSKDFVLSKEEENFRVVEQPVEVPVEPTKPVVAPVASVHVPPAATPSPMSIAPKK